VPRAARRVLDALAQAHAASQLFQRFEGQHNAHSRVVKCIFLDFSSLELHVAA